MKESLFLRLVREHDKSAELRGAIAKVRSGVVDGRAFVVVQDAFRVLPGTTFPYWASDGMRRKFREFPALKDSAFGLVAQRGLYTTDDFRYVRLVWELKDEAFAVTRLQTASRRWAFFEKGGEFSRYYHDIHLVINWGDDGCELKAHLGDYRNRRGWGPNWSAAINAYHDYFRPGVSWPLRSAGLSFRLMPRGCVFGHKGPAVFAKRDDGEVLMPLAAVLNSKPFSFMVRMLLARTELAQSYEVGLLQSIPTPTAWAAHLSRLSTLAASMYSLARRQNSAIETSRFFVLPVLLQSRGDSLSERLDAENQSVLERRRQTEAMQQEVDSISYSLYEIEQRDRQMIEAEVSDGAKGLPELETGKEATAALVSWAFGAAIGRFDVRLGTGDRSIPELPGSFEPLPAYSPGMLPDGKVPTGYPLPVAEDGILVDDKGHEWDLVERVREVFHLVFGNLADAIALEACKILGVGSLRDYLSRLGARGFWDDHVKRYSKSRRRAPIYWLLQSSRGHYSAWVYYHRMSRETLPRLLGRRYVESKLEKVRQAIDELRPGGQTKPGITKNEEQRLAHLDELLVDLEEFGGKIRAVIDRANDRGDVVAYDPDPDDGVILNAAPLHEVIPWPRKKKSRGRSVSELAVYWEELGEGKYDWAHIAMRYWPSRVTEECKRDKSLALAHGLDREFFLGLRAELRRQAETAAPSDAPDDELSTDEDDDQEEEA